MDINKLLKCVCVCVYVCVREIERERQRERETETERERERERERDYVCVYCLRISSSLVGQVKAQPCWSLCTV